MVRIPAVSLSVFFVLASSGIVPEFYRGDAWGQEEPLEGSPRETKSEEARTEGSSHKGTYGLEEVLVVAPPVIEGNQVDRLGSRVTVVTEQQIDNLNAQDLPSALRKTSGVVVSHHNPVGSFGGGEGGAIFIRGMGISRPGAEILILVDGAPKFVSVWTHPLMDVLGVDIIDQMQVYKGAP